jgi:hypothetical protein
MKHEAKAIDFWTLIAVLVLGTIFVTCVLSAFGLKTTGEQRAVGRQLQSK